MTRGDKAWQRDAIRHWLASAPMGDFIEAAIATAPRVAFPDRAEGAPLDTVDNYAALLDAMGVKLRWNVAKRRVEARSRGEPWRKSDATGKNLILAQRRPYDPSGRR
jgi:hypothetical protein